MWSEDVILMILNGSKRNFIYGHWHLRFWDMSLVSQWESACSIR